MPELELNSGELNTLWAKTLGELPDEEQFYLWTNLHTSEVVRQAILKTAGKNLQLGKTMTAEHKVRFASKVMLTLTAQNTANARNREALQADMTRRASTKNDGIKSENRGQSACD
jgi:predicted deacetylase